MLKNLTLVLFVIFPIVSMILGVLFQHFLYNWRYAAPFLSFLLPIMIFFGEKGFAWSAFQANVDSWFLYGIPYAVISLVSIRIASAVKTRNAN